MTFRVPPKSLRYRPRANGRNTVTVFPAGDDPMLSQFWNRPGRNDGAGGASEYVAMPGMTARANGQRPSIPDGDRIEILQSHPLLGPMLVISGVALGNSTFVETSLLADRVHASLSCALVGDNSHQFDDAMDRLTQPLRREQDNRLAALGNNRAKDIRAQIRGIEREREAFFAGAVVRDPAAVASFEEKIRELDKLLRPALIIESPPPGSLERAAARGEGSLLTVYNENLFAVPNRARSDIEVLVRTWQGKTPQTRLLRESATVSPVRPLIGSLFDLNQAALARLACSSDPVVRQFFERLIILGFPGSPLVVPDCWLEVLSRLLATSSQQRCLTLTSGAHARLVAYMAEVERLGSGHCRLNRQGPALAVKNAQILHFWAGDSESQISGETMELGIVKAKELVRESAATANRCVAGEGRDDLDEEEAQLLVKIQVHGPLSDRDLQRKFKKISIEELQARLGPLTEKGRVHRREDGLLEVVRRATGIAGQ